MHLTLSSLKIVAFQEISKCGFPTCRCPSDVNNLFRIKILASYSTFP